MEKQSIANKKWEDKNKEYSNYLKARTSARSFINKKATLDDIKELRKLLEQREEFLKSNE